MFQARARATAAGLLLSVGAATAASAAATTIDFDNLQAGDYTGSLTTQGYVLDPGALGTVPGGWSGHYHIASPLDTSWASSNGSNSSRMNNDLPQFP